MSSVRSRYPASTGRPKSPALPAISDIAETTLDHTSMSSNSLMSSRSDDLTTRVNITKINLKLRGISTCPLFQQPNGFKPQNATALVQFASIGLRWASCLLCRLLADGPQIPEQLLMADNTSKFSITKKGNVCCFELQANRFSTDSLRLMLGRQSVQRRRLSTPKPDHLEGHGSA